MNMAEYHNPFVSVEGTLAYLFRLHADLIMLNIIMLLAKVFVLCFIIIIIMINSFKAKVQNHSMIINFQVKSISIIIGSTGPVITWYRIDTEICSLARAYEVVVWLRAHVTPS